MPACLMGLVALVPVVWAAYASGKASSYSQVSEQHMLPFSFRENHCVHQQQHAEESQDESGASLKLNILHQRCSTAALLRSCSRQEEDIRAQC